MFTKEMQASYASNKLTARSGSRPAVDAFIDSVRRERRFMPLTEAPDGKPRRYKARSYSQDELKAWARIPYGVRQVVRIGGKLSPRFAI